MRVSAALFIVLGACATPRAATNERQGDNAPSFAGIDAGTLRQTPPPGLEANAAAVHAPAPPLDLPTATGERWSLTDAHHRPAILAFYRGHW